MILKRIIKELEKFAPISLQESYDNSGLITGNKDTKIQAALITLDCTEDVIDEAIKKKCNLIIAHHPIIFKGLKKITGSNYIERTIIKAIQNNIAIYAFHTNLDNVDNGVSFKMCELLGLKNCKPLLPKKGLLKKLITFCPEAYSEKVRKNLFNAGAGHIGNYDSCSFNTSGSGTFKALNGASPFVGKPNKLHTEKEDKIETIYPAYLENKILSALFKDHPYEEVAYDLIPLDNFNNKVGSGMIGELTRPVNAINFLKKVKKTFQTPCVRHTALCRNKVQKIAVCGGSGIFLLKQAILNKAEVFITADVKYHQFFDADNEIILADIGHYESEQHTKELILAIIKEKMPNFTVILAKTNTNPLNYL